MKAMLAIVLFAFGVAAQAQMIVSIEANGDVITSEESLLTEIGGVDVSDFAEALSYDWSVQTAEPDSGGVRTGHVIYGNFRIVKALARSSVLLRQAMDTSQVVDLQFRIFAPDPDNGETREIHKIDLTNGRVAAIRPWGDGTTGQYLEQVAFSWESIEFTDVQSGTSYFIQFQSQL